MASMKDAFEECTHDSGSIWKFVWFAIPVFGAVYFYMDESTGFLFWTCAILGLINIVGTMARVANNGMNFRERTLPTYNPFSMFFDFIRTAIALTPALLLNGGITWYLVTSVYPTYIAVEPVAKGATYITIGLCTAIMLTVFMLFAKRFRFSDPFDIQAISESCIDVLIHTIWMLVQLVFVNAFTIGIVTYLFYVFIGLENFLMWFVWSMGVIFNAALIGNYLGQLNHEALHQSENKELEKQLRKELKDARKE